MVDEIKKNAEEMNNKEMLDAIASMMKNALDSFIEKGFTREEAVKIIMQIDIG